MVLFVLFLFVFGLFFGSFLNVLVDRFQSNENPLTGRSHCDYCKKTLAWYDLLPLVSFISTGGKCRYCSSRLSPYYPFAELITGLLFVTAYLHVSAGGIFNFQFLIFNEILNPKSLIINLSYELLIVSSMIVVFFSDLKYGIIPDKVIFPAIIITILVLVVFPSSLISDPLYNLISFYANSYSTLPYYLLSAIVSLLFFLFLFIGTRGRAMGFGDVKFAFLLGLVLGPAATIIALYVAFLTGAGVGLILILWKKKHLKYAIPFGPFLVLGFLIGFFLSPQVISAASGLL